MTTACDNDASVKHLKRFAECFYFRLWCGSGFVSNGWRTGECLRRRKTSSWRKTKAKKNFPDSSSFARWALKKSHKLELIMPSSFFIQFELRIKARKVLPGLWSVAVKVANVFAFALCASFTRRVSRKIPPVIIQSLVFLSDTNLRSAITATRNSSPECREVKLANIEVKVGEKSCPLLTRAHPRAVPFSCAPDR